MTVQDLFTAITDAAGPGGSQKEVVFAFDYSFRNEEDELIINYETTKDCEIQSHHPKQIVITLQ